MQFYEFGKEDKPAIMLIPGTGCSWQGEFSQVIDGLAKDYRIICVSFDGHDEHDHNTFRHINDQILGTEKYIKEHYNGHLYGVYGSSLGGSVLGKLLQRNNVKIDIAITGSTDFEQMANPWATISAALIIPLCYYLVKAKHPVKILRKPLDNVYGDSAKALGIMYKGISYKSLYNVYYTDLVTPVADNIVPESTKIYCTYGTEEDTKTLTSRYIQHFPKAELVALEGMHHEELLVFYPEEWIDMMKHILKQEAYS
jgi:pimeloyl-ACP methyl ester carboxylesterase